MKSRVFTIISMLALVVAMVAAGSASADTSPAQDVYNPNGQVLDVVEGGGNDTVPANDVQDDVESGQAPSVCSAADGRDANGNAVSYGSSADCATTAPSVASGQLPFTGFEAGLVALAGVGLLGAGFAMRRRTPHPHDRQTGRPRAPRRRSGRVEMKDRRSGTDTA